MTLAHSPRIVLNGLVLCLDAANAKSYPGSGTTWTDLTTTRTSVTLLNGVGYNANNLGGVVFDGTNDYCLSGAAFSPVSATDTVTIFCWCKPDSTGPAHALSGLVSWGGRSDATPSNSTVLSLNTASATWGVSASFYFNDYAPDDSAIAIDKDKWNLVGMVARSAATTNNLTLFKFNSSGYGTNTGSSHNYARGVSRTSGAISVGSVTALGNLRMKGIISQVLIYNRELSENEMKQNFNALRGRYGI